MRGEEKKEENVATNCIIIMTLQKRQYVCEIPSDNVQAFWDSAPLQDAADSLKAYVFQKFMQTIPEKDSDQSTTLVQPSNSNIFSILK